MQPTAAAAAAAAARKKQQQQQQQRRRRRRRRRTHARCGGSGGKHCADSVPSWYRRGGGPFDLFETETKLSSAGAERACDAVGPSVGGLQLQPKFCCFLGPITLLIISPAAAAAAALKAAPHHPVALKAAPLPDPALHLLPPDLASIARAGYLKARVTTSVTLPLPMSQSVRAAASSQRGCRIAPMPALRASLAAASRAPQLLALIVLAILPLLPPSPSIVAAASGTDSAADQLQVRQ